MKFQINNTEWTIEEVDEATINNEMKQDGTLGVTIYKSQRIMLLKDQANIIKTLKHELTHVWLYEYGHAQDDNTTYGYEDICEIVASSNDFINEVVYRYQNITKTVIYADNEPYVTEETSIEEQERLMEIIKKQPVQKLS